MIWVEIIGLQVACRRTTTVVLNARDPGRIVMLQIKASVPGWIPDDLRHVDSLSGDCIQNKVTQRLIAQPAYPRRAVAQSRHGDREIRVSSGEVQLQTFPESEGRGGVLAIKQDHRFADRYDLGSHQLETQPLPRAATRPLVRKR